MPSISAENTVNRLIETAQKLIGQVIPERIALMDSMLFTPLKNFELSANQEAFELDANENSIELLEAAEQEHTQPQPVQLSTDSSLLETPLPCTAPHVDDDNDLENLMTINNLIHNLIRGVKPILREFMRDLNAIRTWVFHLLVSVAKTDTELQREQYNLRNLNRMIEETKENINQIGQYFIQRGNLISQFRVDERKNKNYYNLLATFDDMKYSEIYSMLTEMRVKYASLLAMLSEDAIISSLVVIPSV